MTGKKVTAEPCGKRIPIQKKKDWQPLDGVSITINDGIKTSGIKIRGTGAATKGTIARGPMA